MKENDPAGKDEALSKLLRTWKPEAQMPPRFQESVWRRIECVDDEKISVWQTLRGRVEAAFARPALASAYIAVLLFAGVGAGYWRAEDRSAQVESELRSRYVQNVDPYQMPRN
jgi:hypothetical protein